MCACFVAGLLPGVMPVGIISASQMSRPIVPQPPIRGQPIEDGKHVDDVCVGLLSKRRGIGGGRGIDWIKRHGMSHVVSSVL